MGIPGVPDMTSGACHFRQEIITRNEQVSGELTVFLIYYISFLYIQILSLFVSCVDI